MQFLLALMLMFCLAVPVRAQGQLDLLQPATPGQQAASDQAQSSQPSAQQQLQQTPDQGQVLEILGDDIDSSPDTADFDWSLWGPWLAVAITLGVGAVSWLLQNRRQLKA